jgi:hypothetical protein
MLDEAGEAVCYAAVAAATARAEGDGSETTIDLIVSGGGLRHGNGVAIRSRCAL